MALRIDYGPFDGKPAGWLPDGYLRELLADDETSSAWRFVAWWELKRRAGQNPWRLLRAGLAPRPEQGHVDFVRTDRKGVA